MLDVRVRQDQFLLCHWWQCCNNTSYPFLILIGRWVEVTLTSSAVFRRLNYFQVKAGWAQRKETLHVEGIPSSEHCQNSELRRIWMENRHSQHTQKKNHLENTDPKQPCWHDVIGWRLSWADLPDFSGGTRMLRRCFSWPLVEHSIALDRTNQI